MNSLFMLVPGLIFSIQSACFKVYSTKCKQSSGANAFFNTILLGLTALIAMCFSIGSTFDAYSIIYGAIMGVSFFLFIRLYNEAMACGPMAYTVFIFSISMLIPIVASIFMYAEYPSVLNYIGFAFLMVAIFLINFSSQRQRNLTFSKKWVILCIIGTIFNGGVGLMTKIYPMQAPETNFTLFIAVAFLVATILSCVPYFSKNVRASLAEFKPSVWFVVLAVLVALTNFCGNTLYTMFAANFDAGVYFPTVNGSSVLISLVISCTIFREKLKPLAIVGMLIGIMAVMMLSL
ncbi:MAG: EamA family transporter [Bacillota bacterium]